MTITETEFEKNAGSSAPRRTANGATDSAERLDQAKQQLKVKAEEVRLAATERLGQAKVKAAALAQDAKVKASAASQTAVAHAKAHPVQTAVIAAGAVGAAVGLAVMMRNNRSRNIAARTAKSFWSDYGKILLPLATALAVPSKAIADRTPKLASQGSKFAAALPKSLSRHFH